MSLILSAFSAVVLIAAVTLIYAIVLIFRGRALSEEYEQTVRELSDREYDLDRSEQQLRKSKGKFSDIETKLSLLQVHYDAIFNHSRYMLFSFGVTKDGMPGRISQVNDVACVLLERSRADLLKMTILDIEDIEQPISMVRLFHRTELVMLSDAEIRYRNTTSDRQLIKQIINNAAVHYERTYITGTGKSIPVEVRTQRFEVNGKVQILCSAHDISERQRDQRAVREGRQRLRDLLDQSPIGSVLYNADYRL
ncbi:MAG: PAS domain S-box protein, partial [Kiritimatiellae bacterium]|nr:PAS domain S-box protein [Kiritimatiellia bacterium]